MKLSIKNIRLFSSKKNSNEKIININIEELIGKYSQHFKQYSLNYQFPLLKTNTNLCYTNRFSKTIVNLKDVKEQQKLNYFKKIKKSINSNNVLTPKTCVQLCQSISHIPFQGDENQTIEKIRKYAQQNGSSFNMSLADRFNLAYKYLMIEKAKGSIRFKDFQIKRNNSSFFQNAVKNLLIKFKISQVYLSDWNLKKTFKFEMRVNELKRNIKINGLNIQSKQVQAQLISNRICQFAKKNQNIYIIKDYLPKSIISNEILAKYLLTNIQIGYTVDQLNMKESEFFDLLLKKIITVVNPPYNKIKVLKMSDIQFLNEILNYSSVETLKNLFGYLKFNMFHSEFQKLLMTLNIQKRKISKEFPHLSNSNLQIEQKVQFNMMSPYLIYAKYILKEIKEKQLKSINIYLNQNNVYQFLFYFLKCQNQNLSQTKIDQNQNKNLSIMKNKLALTSTIYNIPLNLKILNQQIRSLRSSLYPLSYPFRYKDQSE